MYLAKIPVKVKDDYKAHQIVMEWYYGKRQKKQDEHCPHFQIRDQDLLVFLADSPKPGSFQVNPDVEAGSRFNFSIRLNPAKRSSATRIRFGLIEPGAVESWISRKSLEAGFNILKANIDDEGIRGGSGMSHRSVFVEGVLEVTDVGRFRKALYSGIGPAKGFGYGMLNIFGC